ncbi:hypothetical protein BO83DRAFT_381429 [Aspergillus eucalypticola CBS 122712]|uniref:Uncharacterized protein n=1 Tax=Aspergillus eucalypticola (strain CBS 122712 / IBT 29274) TaxID=1448314 RepID=A0A317UZX6_ASPEC|nr:uncharacterized protein BO83DRAFT_381429 [Aspergillus eucalypticola CBS 122712]PWY65490.1 hypothetical protein BO83DRAFT_381429 [Aspergillus eucalypticola CBS 122712]
MVLYLAGQILGGALAGSFGSGQYSVGGCVVDTALVPVREAFRILVYAGRLGGCMYGFLILTVPYSKR